MLSEQAARRLPTDAVDWSAVAPDPVSSLFKQDLRTQLRWREGPVRDLPFYPIPNARRAGHRVRGTPDAHEDDPPPRRSDKAADRPLPACRHLQHKRPAARSRRGTGTARRQGGRQHHRRAGSGQPGTALRSKDPRRRPAELLVKSKAAPTSSHAGRHQEGTPGSDFSTPSCELRALRPRKLMR
jgi:hypothetical protein